MHNIIKESSIASETEIFLFFSPSLSFIFPYSQGTYELFIALITNDNIIAKLYATPYKAASPLPQK